MRKVPEGPEGEVTLSGKHKSFKVTMGVHQVYKPCVIRKDTMKWKDPESTRRGTNVNNMAYVLHDIWQYIDLYLWKKVYKLCKDQPLW